MGQAPTFDICDEKTKELGFLLGQEVLELLSVGA